MFSGIIEGTGRITSISRGKNGGRLAIDADKLAATMHDGDSLAVDGICLTVVTRSKRTLHFDISAETWSLTNLVSRVEGDRVNLERPLSAGAMVSGHFVLGHVDGIGSVAGWTRKGDDVRLKVQLSRALEQYCVPKGSIAINGVSLTIASLKRRFVEVALIPYTLQVTNLSDLQPGAAVNVETDVLGKYVVSLIKKGYHRSNK